MALTLAGTPAINGLALPSDTFVSGMVLVASQSFTAASTVSVNNCFTSAYENYVLVISQDSASINIQLRLRASGSDNSTSNYNRTGASINAGGSSNFGSGSAESFWYLGNTDGSSVSTTNIFRPQLATRTGMTTLTASGSPNSFYTAGHFTQTTQFDGFTMFYSSGSNTGTVRVYGLRNA
jgi:hypothetical protein